MQNTNEFDAAVSRWRKKPVASTESAPAPGPNEFDATVKRWSASSIPAAPAVAIPQVSAGAPLPPEVLAAIGSPNWTSQANVPVVVQTQSRIPVDPNMLPPLGMFQRRVPAVGGMAEIEQAATQAAITPPTDEEIAARNEQQIAQLPGHLQTRLAMAEATAEPEAAMYPRLGGLPGALGVTPSEGQTGPSVGERMFVDAVGRPVARMVVSPVAQVAAQIKPQFRDDLSPLADAAVEAEQFAMANPPTTNAEAYARRAGSALTTTATLAGVPSLPGAVAHGASGAVRAAGLGRLPQAAAGVAGFTAGETVPEALHRGESVSHALREAATSPAAIVSDVANLPVAVINALRAGQTPEQLNEALMPIENLAVLAGLEAKGALGRRAVLPPEVRRAIGTEPVEVPPSRMPPVAMEGADPSIVKGTPGFVPPSMPVERPAPKLIESRVVESPPVKPDVVAKSAEESPKAKTYVEEIGDAMTPYQMAVSLNKSWVIRNKATGEAMFETFNPAVVNKLNRDKYEAISTLQHLTEFNRKIAESKGMNASKSPAETGPVAKPVEPVAMIAQPQQVLRDVPESHVKAEAIPVESAPVAKQPWEMTRDEFRKALIKEKNDARSRYESLGGGIPARHGGITKARKGDAASRAAEAAMNASARLENFDSRRDVSGLPSEHRDAVEAALREGRNVPAEVLKDYPDLANVTAQPARQAEAVKPSVPPTQEVTNEVLTKAKAQQGQGQKEGLLKPDASATAQSGSPAPKAGASRDAIESAMKSRGVRGDNLLNAIDRIEDLQNGGGEITADGAVALYHRTTKESADRIIATGKMDAKEDGLFFGTKPTGQIEGYGDAVVKVTLPIERIEINDVFTNETHVRLPLGSARSVPIKAELWGPRQQGPPAKPAVSEPPKNPPADPVRDNESAPRNEKIVGLSLTENANIRSALRLEDLPPKQRETHIARLNKAIENKTYERALSDAEAIIRNRSMPDADTHTAFVVEAARKMNEWEQANKLSSELVEKGNLEGARIEAERANAISDQLDLLTRASDLGGAQVARALSIRRMRLNREDMSLAAVAQRARSAKGERLSPEELAKFQKLTESHAMLEKEIGELRQRDLERETELQKIRAEKFMRGESVGPVPRSRTQVKRERLLAERQELKNQLVSLGFRMNDITGIGPEAAYLVGRLAINYAKEGALTLSEVVSKIKGEFPDLTDLDIYRSINAKDPKAQKRAEDQATKRVRELRKQANLLSRLADAEEGVFPGKSPRPKPSPEVQELRTKLDALKKEANRGPKQEAQIARLEEAIRNAREGKFKLPIPRPKPPEAVAILRKQLTLLRNQAYKTVRESDRLERAVRTINELQDQLHNHSRALRRKQETPSAEISEMRKKIASLRREMKVEDEITDLEQQLESGDFKSDVPGSERLISPELERKEIHLHKLRREVRNAIDDMRPRTKMEKLGEAGQEAINTFRTLKATADMSATLRQGLVLAVSHPVKAMGAFGKSVKAFFSEHSAEHVDYAIRNAPQHYLREKAGLELTELSGRPSKREEHFMSRLAEKIPAVGHLVKASDRHMTSYLNMLRTAVFDQFMKATPNATTEQMDAMAKYVNYATGRGNLGKASSIGKWLGLIFFAPKFAVSRFQTPYIMAKNMSVPGVRKEMARSMASMTAFGSTLLTLAHLAGLKVGLDPRDSDFGKIVYGDERYDIWAGFQQPARLLARMMLSATDSLGITDPPHKKKIDDPLEMLGRFASFKLAPTVTLPYELVTGKNVIGQQVGPTEALLHSVIPITLEETYEAFKKDGIGSAMRVGLPSFFGVGVSVHDNRNKAKKAAPYKRMGY